MCVMISCLIFSASCCAAEPPLPVCIAAWCPLYQGMLSHLVFIMLGCLIFSISCQAAGPSLPHVRVLAVPQSMLCYLVLLSRCYIVWFDPSHATLLRHPGYHVLLSDFLFQIFASWSFDLAFMMLKAAKPAKLFMLSSLPHVTFLTFPASYGVLSSRCCAVWSSQPHATLLHRPPYLMLPGVLSISGLCFLVIWSCLHDAKLFDLLCITLSSWPSLPHALLPAFCSLYHVRLLWFCLCDATLPDLLYLMLDCFTATTSWYAVWSSPYHVMLQNFVFMMLRCLTFSTSCYAALLFLNLSSRCYAAWWYLLHATLLHFPYVIPSCFVSFVSFLFPVWNCLHDATLLDLLYFMPQCLTFPTSCYFSLSSPNCVFQIDLACRTLRCLMFSASCYGASPSLPHVKLHQVTLLDLVFMTLRCLTFSTSCFQDRPSPRYVFLHRSRIMLRGLIWPSWC